MRLLLVLLGIGAALAVQNCTTTHWSQWGPCSVQCSVGSQNRTRTETAPGDGTYPCVLTDFASCTNVCWMGMSGRGYIAWGPWTGTASLTYNIAAYQYPVDIFVFTDQNYALYQQDASLPTPYNSGFLAVRSMLNTQNAQDTVALQSGTNYYLVMDNTPIGAANGNNGAGQYSQLTISYFFQGIPQSEMGQPINTNPSSATLAIPSVFAFVSCLLAWLLL